MNEGSRRRRVAQARLTMSSRPLQMAFLAILLCLIQTRDAAQDSHSSAHPVNTGVVNVMMRNVNFHFTDRIAVRINSLDGSLTTNRGAFPIFDDKDSFNLRIDSANIRVSTTALTNDLNDYVFSRHDAPLTKLVVATKGNELVLKGVLTNKDIPFESDGTVAATSDGQIRVHALKVKALHLPVKGLMDLVGLDTAKLIDTKKIKGVTADKDDLILDPQQLFPPPQMLGQLRSIQIESGAVTLIFGSEGQQRTVSSRCGGRNFQAFRGGAVRFGKLTMNDTDLELIDVDPSDPFDFSIDHYQDQLIAGYSKSTKRGGLCVYMPDFNKLQQKPR